MVLPETNGKYFIGDKEIGELTNITMIAPWGSVEIDKSWMFDVPRSFTVKLKLKYENKIDAALGFTHYVKKGKIFRK